jgi:hypothetical protein
MASYEFVFMEWPGQQRTGPSAARIVSLPEPLFGYPLVADAPEISDLRVP